jgi:hypothetical protein
MNEWTECWLLVEDYVWVGIVVSFLRLARCLLLVRREEK